MTAKLKPPTRLPLVLAALALLGGCQGRKHERAIDPGTLESRRIALVRTPSQSLEAARAVKGLWQRQLALGARQHPGTRFPSPGKQKLLQQLRQAARHYHFSLRRLSMRRPLQLAPLIVVEARDPDAMARAVPAIIRLIDPKRDTNDDRTGWSYEGLYFEARDSAGIPFLIVYDFMRGRSPGGGQWARREGLYPYSHG